MHHYVQGNGDREALDAEFTPPFRFPSVTVNAAPSVTAVQSPTVCVSDPLRRCSIKSCKQESKYIIVSV
ncbi:hypothetical protein JOB18_005088 [Solea senegalensis]|uniref:Uncharacterized protein n=1 Tax=Solea senegalensis TaxID=28829 RepID=A0AAV6RTB2_SOLSE|nr:hypothetical protein JOB18_005088 [Solea senegalensis]